MTGQPRLRACTPYGVMKMLEFHKVPVWGANAVVIGASNIVGKPMAMMLLQAGATVTICNSKTRDLASHTRNADIIVAAGNGWWTSGTAIVAIQQAGTVAWSRLFGLPLVWGVVLTALDVLLILMLQQRGFRYLEAFVIALLIIIAGCFAYQIAVSQPVVGDVLRGFVPSTEIVIFSGYWAIRLNVSGTSRSS